MEKTEKEVKKPEYVSLQECQKSGLHLQSCDDDGCCNRCGEQVGGVYEEIHEPSGGVWVGSYIG